MCGKFTQMMSWGEFTSLAELLNSTNAPGGSGQTLADLAEIVSPMREAFVVRLNRSGARETARMRWGLLPYWAKDPGIGTRRTHARAETIDTTNAYKDAFRYRRGLIIVSEFYESRHATA